MSRQTTYAAIEIGGSKLQLAVGDAAGKVLERFRFSVDRRQGAEGIRRQIETKVKELLAARQPRAVGVGYGGPVNWRNGQIRCSHHIEGWSDFPLGDWLRSLTGLPVVVDNDANVAALGEAIHGAGRSHNPVFYVTLGSGVGGGLVVDGSIYHGATPGEAELGHVRLDRQGTILEARCSGWAVDKKIRAFVKRHPKSRLGRLVGKSSGGEARYLGAALGQNDASARRILRETASDLAFGLSHVVHLFHPEIIVIGGGLALLGEPLRAAVGEALPRFVMAAFGAGPRVALAALGEDSVPVGALVLACRSAGN
jgi:glucokinase